MKRNSILYDYKPRLQWAETRHEQRQQRRRKILFLTLSFSLVSAAVIGANHFTSVASLNFSRADQSITSLSETTSIHQKLTLEKLPSSREPIKDVASSKEITARKGGTTIDPEHSERQSSLPSPAVVSKKQVELEKRPFEPKVVTTSTPIETIVPIEKKAKIDEQPSLRNKDLWKKITVRQGDNLSLIFSRLAISKNDLYQILSLGDKTQSLKHLKPGQVLRLKYDDSRIEELVHEADMVHRLEVKKTDEDFQAKMIEEQPTVEVASSSGSIQDSLFVSGQKAGLSDNVIMQMFDIFGWDIDFVLDIRLGDEFHIIYEELHKNGEKIKDGRILAAEFVNQGNAYKAVRYVDSEGKTGYYTENGHSMRKAFLRTPVNFTRISSHFNLNRKHPVLNTIRAHKGVDYAAPTGTPVQSTGFGKILFAGKKNGYGNTVIIQHGGKYETLYAHLTRFTRGLKKGQRIEQGQTVGYVGQTGLATGPHLHYEFRVDGVHRNPLTVELPKSLPLPEEYMRDFEQQTKTLITQLNSMTDGYHLAKTPQKQAPVIQLAKRESLIANEKYERNIN